MSGPLLVLVAAIYLMVSGSYYAAGNYGMSLAFFAYAVANVGFIWARP